MSVIVQHTFIVVANLISSLIVAYFSYRLGHRNGRKKN